MEALEPFLQAEAVATACLVARGCSEKEIADALNIAESSVHSRIWRLMKQHGMSNRNQFSFAFAEFVGTFNITIGRRPGHLQNCDDLSRPGLLQAHGQGRLTRVSPWLPRRMNARANFKEGKCR